MFASLSPQRRRLVYGLIAGVVLAILAGVVVGVVGRQRVRPVPPDQPGPVLLVAGYGGRVESLDPIARVLRAAGRTVVVVQPVGGNTGDLRAEAKHLGAVAEQARRDAGAPSIDVVGYSAGGVIARLWVREEGGAGVARRVLSVGSPQHGTSQAALGQELAGGCSAACEQLVPGSDLLRQLNAGDETPAGPAWVTLWSRADTVVDPPESAELDGALNIEIQSVCPSASTGHGDLPADPVTLAALGSVLGADPPAVPTGVTC